MFFTQAVIDLLNGGVIEQQRTEQCLFSLKVMRHGTPSACATRNCYCVIGNRTGSKTCCCAFLIFLRMIFLF